MITTNMFLTDYGLNIPVHYYWGWDLIYFISFFAGMILGSLSFLALFIKLIDTKFEGFVFFIVIPGISIYSFFLLAWLKFCINKSMVFLN